MRNKTAGLLWTGTGALVVAVGVFMSQTPSNAAVNSEGGRAAARPVLVELFTSQGCSSCPPADAVLSDLAARSDVLPLAFHVDYWDYLGWVDPFSSPAFTARQQQYAQRRGFNMYTPQLVVDGRSAIVGSNRSGVSSNIAAAKDDAKSASASLRREGGDVSIVIGAVAAAKAAGTVYLIIFDERQTTAIRSGENAGRSIVYTNVVRSMRVIGEWRNSELKLSEHLRPEERGERLALVVQGESGEVWAVASTAALQKAASN